MMNKLIKLLNEYENYLDTTNRDDIQVHFRHINWADVKCFHNYSFIISKRYLFIKRLVDNDKIETNNLSLKAFKNIFSGGGFVEVSDLEVLLMLLAISDTPIDDLISYLK